MKLKLTPELFILQDVASQIATSQDEAKKEERLSDEPMLIVRDERSDEFGKEINLNRKVKQINRTKRFIETPEFELLNQSKFKQETQLFAPNSHNQPNQIDQTTVESPVHFGQPLEPNVKIIQNNGRLALDKQFVMNRRKPKREIIQSDIRCITLNKEKHGSSFGLTIRGGLEFNRPLIIAAIQRNSIADKCRSLFLGDLVVELNGQPMYPIRYTHEQAMKLVKTGGNRLYLTLKHLTMFNRPIARCWQRQMNMSWLNECENKLDENWHNLSQTANHMKLANQKNETTASNNQFSNKSSSQESYIHQSSNINQDGQVLTDCEQYSNCGTTTLSNLTDNLTATVEKDDLLTPSPLMNDEGVYTGLSNDALSTSECTSDGSGFSSDYVTTTVNNSTHHHHSNQNCTYHQTNNKLTCSSSCCMKKNNNNCTKCIVNMNYSDQVADKAGKIDQNMMNNHYCDKENIINDYSFRTNQQVKHTSLQTNGNQDLISSCSSFDDGSSSRTTSINRTSLVDIVSVSLINCYFTKYIHNTDNIRRNGMEVRWLNSHNQRNVNSSKLSDKKSMDVHSAVISFNDVELAQQFQQQINHYLTKLNESYMFSFNRGLKPQNRILFMGWISLALPKSSKLNQQPPQTSNLQLNSSLDYNWSPKYMILKGGEMLLYDCPPDYLLDKIQYTNDTLLEFNELSDLLINKNGTLTCSITLNNDLNRKPKTNTQQTNRMKSRVPLTRHLSIRGRDYSINKSTIPQFEQLIEQNGDRSNDPKILTEANNQQQQKSASRLICTLTRNLSLKTAKENRYKATGNKTRSVAHCTLPKNQITDLSSSHFSPDKQQQISRRTPVSENLFKSNENHPISQQTEWTNEPIIFKAYESVLRQLRPDEQLDKRENCLLALTTKSDNAVSNDFKPMSSFRKQSTTNHSTGELDNNSNWNTTDSYSRKNSLDSNLNGGNESNATSITNNKTMVAYLAVEHADNIAQILKSWNVATMHSVIQLSKKSFYVMSEGRYCCLTLDFNTGFTLYDGSNVKWNFKFSQLKNSSDDGSRTLWLSFQSIKHQPVIRTQRPNQTLNSLNRNQSNSSLNSSMDSVDQYSQRNRAMTPSSFDSSFVNGNDATNSTIGSNNQLGSADYLMNNSNYLQTNRTEFRIKKSIETKEITCSNIQHLIYCMHSFLSAKVTNCVTPMTNQSTSLNGILV